jgi:hypothetical protein
MSGPIARLLFSYSYKAMEQLRRVCPPLIRRRIRRLLGSRGVAAINYLIKGNALATIQGYERTMNAAAPGQADEYNRLLAGNAAGQLWDVMHRFYGDLGVDAGSIPLVQGLDRFRQKLSSEAADKAEPETASTLIRFETAWGLYRQRRVDAALPLFEAVFRDVAARKRAGRDPFIKEAVVRSGEILGRRQDTSGNSEQAVAIYQEIMTIDLDGVIARRLAVLLARCGDLRKAAERAESIIVSRPNLFPFLPEHPYIASLKAEISRKPE